MKSHIVWHNHHLSKKDHSGHKNQRPCILWLTGLSGSGKSTIANVLESKLYELGKHTYLLDGDNVRHGLNKDLGFGNADRIENIRRIGEVSKLFSDAGLIVITAFISPFCSDRDIVRNLVEDGEFIEIFVDTPIHICEQRDPKGLYIKARAGEIADFTGISSPYESPKEPEIHLFSEQQSIEESVHIIITYLHQKGYLNA
jgi:adenylylsulfate kinase